MSDDKPTKPRHSTAFAVVLLVASLAALLWFIVADLQRTHVMIWLHYAAQSGVTVESINMVELQDGVHGVVTLRNAHGAAEAQFCRPAGFWVHCANPLEEALQNLGRQLGAP